MSAGRRSNGFSGHFISAFPKNMQSAALNPRRDQMVQRPLKAIPV
jgi:hypothetical protein